MLHGGGYTADFRARILRDRDVQQCTWDEAVIAQLENKCAGVNIQPTGQASSKPNS
jgi:hypothetical protein